MLMRSRLLYISLAASSILGAVFLAACSGGEKEAALAGKKNAATQAVDTAQQSYDAVRRDAVQYIPDQAKGVDDAIARAKASLDKGDYDAAVNEAKPIPDTVNGFAAAIAAKKTEMTAVWKDVSRGVPEMLDAVQKRLAVLSSGNSVPAGMDKDGVVGAMATYDTAAKAWADAKGDFSSANVGDAVAKARIAKDKAVEVMSVLGMKAPPATLLKR